MLKKLLIYIVFLFSCPNFATNQNFISNNLKHIYDQLSVYHFSDLSKIESRKNASKINENCYIFQTIIDNSKLFLTYSERKDSVITHIGIYLFDKFPSSYPPQLYQFIERYILKIMLNNGKLVGMKNSGTHFLINGKEISLDKHHNRQVIGIINNINSRKINNLEDGYEFEISDSTGNNFLFIFPKNYSLISGMDKKELDDFIYSELSSYKRIKRVNHRNKIPAIDELVKTGNGLYATKGKRIFKGINTCKYYSLTNEKITLLYDAKYPTESIINLLHNPEIDSASYNIKVVQHLYGGLQKELNISLANFIEFFRDDYELYVGIESATDDTIKIVLAFYQKDFNYLNLVALKIPNTSLFNCSDVPVVWEGDFYAYIRIDNIGNIFKGFTAKGNRYNIKVNKE